MKSGAKRRREGWALAHYIQEARQNRYFDQLWNIDPLFKPYSAAVLGLMPMSGMSAGERSRIYNRVATEPRSKFVTELAGVQVRSGSLRLLANTDYENFQDADWRMLLRSSNDCGIRRELHQLDRISPVLVRQLKSVPALIRCAAIFSVLDDLAVSEDHWRQLAASLKDAPPTVCKSLAERARKVHSVGSFWDFFFESVDGIWKPSALPESFFGSPMLTPLATAREMRREGAR